MQYEFTSAGQTGNKKYYIQVLWHLQDAVHSKQPEKWSTGNWQIHNTLNSARATLLSQTWNTRSAAISIFSPPCTVWLSSLFPKIKLDLWGRRFDDVEIVKQNMTHQFLSTSKRDVQKCFEQWKNHWNKCIKSQGNYFEGV